MAKLNKVTEATTTEAQVEVVASTHTHNLPMDGSKGEEFIKEQGGVSKAIRTLTQDGHKRGVVAKMLNKRYQHVRNVLITPIKKEG
jgi:hypothetical protein